MAYYLLSQTSHWLYRLGTLEQLDLIFYVSSASIIPSHQVSYCHEFVRRYGESLQPRYLSHTGDVIIAKTYQDVTS